MTFAVVRSSSLIDFKRLAIALNLDPIALMKRVGIQRRFLKNPELTLPASAVAELIEVSALASGIEDFGLRLGEARGLPGFRSRDVVLLREQRDLSGLRCRLWWLFLHMHSMHINPHFEAGRCADVYHRG